MGYNWATKKMKKVIVIIITIALMPFASMGSDNIKANKSHNTVEDIKTNDDWTPIGTTVITKSIGITAKVEQTVQVYRNSAGTRAIKDGRYYHEIQENKRYGKFPSEDCWSCGFRYWVLYEEETWYTHGIVKQTYGSY